MIGQTDKVKCCACGTDGEVDHSELEGRDYRVAYRFSNGWFWAVGEWYCLQCTQMLHEEAG